MSRELYTESTDHGRSNIFRRHHNEDVDRETDAWCEYLNLLEKKKRNGVASAKELELLDRVAGRQKARA